MRTSRAEVPSPDLTVESAESAPVETQRVFERDTDGRWEYKDVPKDSVVGAGDISEGFERGGGAAFDTSGYDPSYNYYFAPRDRNHPSAISTLQRQYAPHKHNGPLMPGHTLEKVAGWGDSPVITVGDTVCVAVPKPIAEARDAHERNMRDRYKANRDSMMEERAAEILDRNNMTSGKDRVIAERTVYREEVAEIAAKDGMERATEMAQSLVRAQEYQQKQDARVFGGFRGDPAYNKAVQDSKLNIAQ